MRGLYTNQKRPIEHFGPLLCSCVFSYSYSASRYSYSYSNQFSIAIRSIGPQVTANRLDQRSASPQFKQPSSSSWPPSASCRRGQDLQLQGRSYFFSYSYSASRYSYSYSIRSSKAIRPIGPQVTANRFDQRSVSPQFKQPSSTSTVRRGGLSTASLSTASLSTSRTKSDAIHEHGLSCSAGELFDTPLH